jgi:UDP-glucose 4-epimerase
MRVLVTGGAGYIGSHMALVLLRAGHDVVVVDDLSTGHRDAVAPGAVFVEAGVADRARMGEVLRVHGVEAILHFAARIQVGESVSDPRRYYEGNVAASIALLDSALDAGVKRFVLSSTAAVYGDPVRVPIDEDHPTSPSSACSPPTGGRTACAGPRSATSTRQAPTRRPASTSATIPRRTSCPSWSTWPSAGATR